MTTGVVLSYLNSPPLVAYAGTIAVAVGLPALEKACEAAALGAGNHLSWPAVKVGNALLLLINIWAASQPGRIDAPTADNNNTTVASDPPTSSSSQTSSSVVALVTPETKEALTVGRSRSLLMPSPWAFIIWAFIFLGETNFCGSSAFLSTAATRDKNTVLFTPIIGRASGGFMVAQFLQALWSAAFRPKYATKEKKYLMFLSTGLLVGIAYSLSRSHAAFATAPALGAGGVDVATSSSSLPSLSLLQYLTYFLPMTLHFGWTTAASLVNLNGAMAVVLSLSEASLSTTDTILGWVGHASVIAATAVGVGVTIIRHAPVYGGVIAWALIAVATRTNRLIVNNDKRDKSSKDEEERSRIFRRRSLVFQKWLCSFGVIASGTASIFAMSRRFVVVQEWFTIVSSIVTDATNKFGIGRCVGIATLSVLSLRRVLQRPKKRDE